MAHSKYDGTHIQTTVRLLSSQQFPQDHTKAATDDTCTNPNPIPRLTFRDTKHKYALQCIRSTRIIPTPFDPTTIPPKAPGPQNPHHLPTQNPTTDHQLHTLTSTHAYMHLHTCIHAPPHMHTCTSTHAYMHLHTCIHAPVHTYLHTSDFLEKCCSLRTSGAIQAYVPATLMCAVWSISLASPKSVILILLPYTCRLSGVTSFVSRTVVSMCVCVCVCV